MSRNIESFAVAMLLLGFLIMGGLTLKEVAESGPVVRQVVWQAVGR